MYPSMLGCRGGGTQAMIPVLEQMSEEETVGEPRCSFFKTPRKKKKNVTGWWVSNIFYVHPYLGEWSNLTYIFQMGWNRQLGN